MSSALAAARPAGPSPAAPAPFLALSSALGYGCKFSLPPQVKQVCDPAQNPSVCDQSWIPAAEGRNPGAEGTGMAPAQGHAQQL